MRINKKVQYGVLFVLYLLRAGKSTVSGAAETMMLSPSLLAQVAHKLAKAGVIKSQKGQNGGYVADKKVTAMQIFNALSPVSIISNKDISKYQIGTAEERAFGAWSQDLNRVIKAFFAFEVYKLSEILVKRELQALNDLGSESVN